MLDINLIREQPDIVRKAMTDRQMDASSVDAILQLDEKRRSLLTEVEKLKAERNAVSKEISQLKDASAKQSRIEAMRLVGDKINALDKEVVEVESQLNALDCDDSKCSRSAHAVWQGRQRECCLANDWRTKRV